MTLLNSIFDTRVDTNKIYVSMKTKFIIRKTTGAKSLAPIYLHITGSAKRFRVNLDIKVDPNQWDTKLQRLKPLTDKSKDLNLILDNVDSKITNIKTVYRLSEKVLSPAGLAKELVDGLPRVNFCAFFAHTLKEEKPSIGAGTYRRYESVLNKLVEHQAEIIFTEITENWFFKYRKYLKGKGNRDTTINSNIIAIKKFLRIAIKQGVKLPCNLDDIKCGPTTGNRTSLKSQDLIRIYKFYKSEFIKPGHKLVIGYFLFSCMTGLRDSDIRALNRQDLSDGYISFTTVKTKKDQNIKLNDRAKEIVALCPELFLTKFTNEHLNRELKAVMVILGIKKHVTFHVARHTFATSFLRMGGRVEKLQLLMGHSNIKETMIYVHIVSAEANDSIHLLDQLF